MPCTQSRSTGDDASIGGACLGLVGLSGAAGRRRRATHARMAAHIDKCADNLSRLPSFQDLSTLACFHKIKLQFPIMYPARGSSGLSGWAADTKEESGPHQDMGLESSGTCMNNRSHFDFNGITSRKKSIFFNHLASGARK